MSRRRSFVGLTTLVVVIIILFMLVFSSLAYLNSDNFSKRAYKRVSIREQQYEVEYEMFEQVFKINEEYDIDNLKELIVIYDLEKDNDYYCGELVSGDYKIVYYLKIDQDVTLESYYLVNISEQEYGEQSFDF